jgi:FixJ family two-component response regulator
MTSAAVLPNYLEATLTPVHTPFRCQSAPTSKLVATSIVFVMDEDAAVRKSLGILIRDKGWKCETFSSAQEFLSSSATRVPNCLLLDASFQGPNSLELQCRVAADFPGTPIILIAGEIDVPTTVKAMKAGAIELLVKPLCEEVLVGSIREALERSRTLLAYAADMRSLRDRYSILSRREREVMALVAAGLLNKQVGGELGISEITVKAHRGQVMHKMKANSLADLVKMAGRLGVASALAA